MYSLKIEGKIAHSKKEEFNQSINLFIRNLSLKCHDYHISEDILDQNIFYFNSTWNSKMDLEEFMKEDHYKVIIGAFKVLGENIEVSINEIN